MIITISVSLINLRIIFLTLIIIIFTFFCHDFVFLIIIILAITVLLITGAQGPSSVNPSSLNISSSNALSSSERGQNGGAATGQTKGVGANGGHYYLFIYSVIYVYCNWCFVFDLIWCNLNVHVTYPYSFVKSFVNSSLTNFKIYFNNPLNTFLDASQTHVTLPTGGAGNTVSAATITGASAGFFPSATIGNLKIISRLLFHSRSTCNLDPYTRQ